MAPRPSRKTERYAAIAKRLVAAVTAEQVHDPTLVPRLIRQMLCLSRCSPTAARRHIRCALDHWKDGAPARSTDHTIVPDQTEISP